MAAPTYYDEIVKGLLDRHIRPGDRVIDVGCGTGWTALFLTRAKPNCHVTGIDLNELKIHRANARFQRAKRDHLVHCVLCAAEELSRYLGRRSFDCAVVNLAVHHFADPRRALRQIHTVLKRGGTLILTDYEPRYGERIDDCPRFSLAKLREFGRSARFRIQSAARVPPGVLTMVARSQ